MASSTVGPPDKLREEFLELLERDAEFRYAVMGLLGFREILDRIARLEERFAKLEERFAQLGERFAKLGEEFKKLAERQQKLEERQQKLEEKFAELEERFAKLEERFAELGERQQKLEERQQLLEERIARLEERQQKLEERMIKVEERLAGLEEAIAELAKNVRELSKAVGSLGRRLGKGFESLFRLAYKDLLENLGVKEYEVTRLRYVDTDGRYLARGSIIEIDVCIHNNQLWLIEVKSLAEADDIVWFRQKTEIAEKILGRKAQRKILLAVNADREAVDQAKKLGVELVAGAVVD